MSFSHCKTAEAVTSILLPFQQRVLLYLRVVGEHVVPQDGSPGVRHLADV